MPKVRLIDADAAADKIMRDTETHADEIGIGAVAIMIAFARALRDETDFPTIEAEPVRHGRWIEAKKHRDENGTILTDYECSECFAMLKDIYPEEIESERFCYNCGADMREVSEDAG